MTTEEAIAAIIEITRKCPDVAVKVLTISDVYDNTGLSAEHAEDIRNSYVWKHWDQFNYFDIEEISNICVEVVA